MIIDSWAPSVRIGKPEPGTEVREPFDAAIHAVDGDDNELVFIEVYFGGALLGAVAGPDAVVRIDPAEYARGELLLEAVAVDQAGNRSETASVPLIVL